MGYGFYESSSIMMFLYIAISRQDTLKNPELISDNPELISLTINDYLLLHFPLFLVPIIKKVLEVFV